jgi:excisionase family DNA binding protein
MSDQNISVSIQLLTGEEVARILKISRAYAYRLMKQGDIPTIKMGRTVRVSYDNLLKFIQENTAYVELN